MALFPLKDLLDGTKRLFVGIQAKDTTGVYKDLKVNADSELVTAPTELTVHSYFTGTTAVTKTYTTDMKGFSVINDATSILTFTINSISIEVKPGEAYESRFKNFKKVVISATGAFRAQVLE